ncbi:MAG: CoA-binding protein [Candidatus Nanopelagicales bacterium]|nr:CoA-binding protein [Candidatus Nanopelagicales bacterium]
MTAKPSAQNLTSLFAPSSIAVFGASSRQGRPGYQVLEALQRIDPSKSIYPITPRYEEILGLKCFSDIGEAPAAELAIIAGSSDRIETEVSAAIACGAKSLLVFGAPTSNPDRPKWLCRIGDMAREAEVSMLGPDTLGFVNYSQKCGATWAIPEQIEPGGIAIVSQSGTVYWEAITNDPRLRFSFSGHSGLESTLTMADLIKYCLTIDSTRVIGIYVETVRDAEGFEQSLAEAADREIPVVALYAGRTDKSRTQMMTHAGRLAGGRSDLEGILNRYGVARATSPDEWWTTLALLGSERRIGTGGLAAVMDSGGGLAMYLDFAEELGVPLAELSPATKNEISVLLGYDGEIGSALDFWIGDSDRHARTEKLIATLAADDDTAAVMAFTTYAESKSAGFAESVADACLQVITQTAKPIVAATYTSRQLQPDLMLRIADAGIPILDGMKTALIAFRHAFRYRSFQTLRNHLSSNAVASNIIDTAQIDSWKRRFGGASQLAEADALAFLSDFDIPCVRTIRANTVDGAVDAAEELGYPVVLKTDEGLAHKAAHGGVHLALQDSNAVRSAYSKVAAGLGPKVIIAPMASGREIAIGMVYGQFGPTMMISAGGVLIELLKDRCYLLGPVSPEEVKSAVEDLQVMRVISESLGLNAVAETKLYELISRISHLAFAFGGVVSELDINPVLVSADGCVAVDALIGLSSN